MHEALSAFIDGPKSPWTAGLGQEADVVLSSRLRLARNFKEEPFPNRQQRESAYRVWKTLSDMAEGKDGYHFFDLSRLSALERQIFVEKHWMSPVHAGDDGYRALVLGDEGQSALMVNEEDHLRLQVFAPGLSLTPLWERASALDDAIEAEAAYAFDPRLGYLTACPTNLGTGLRASLLVHLPGLRLVNRLDLLQSLTQTGMAVRGLYGEGSASAGDLYQISNQQTLGRSEEDILLNLQNVATTLIAAERQARALLLERDALAFDDRVWRSYGILRTARRMSGKEAFEQISMLRLGVAMERIDGPGLPEVDRLYLRSQPGILMRLAGRTLSETELDEYRARALRGALAAKTKKENHHES